VIAHRLKYPIFLLLEMGRTTHTQSDQPISVGIGDQMGSAALPLAAQRRKRPSTHALFSAPGATRTELGVSGVW